MELKTASLFKPDRVVNLTSWISQRSNSAYKPVIPLDYVIALSAGARKLTDFISDRLFVHMTVERAYALAGHLFTVVSQQVDLV